MLSLVDEELILAVLELVHQGQQSLEAGLIPAQFPHECVEVTCAEKVHLGLLLLVHARLEEHLAVCIIAHRQYLDLRDGNDGSLAECIICHLVN